LFNKFPVFVPDGAIMGTPLQGRTVTGSLSHLSSYKASQAIAVQALGCFAII
jgi:hypothetical protein